MDDPACICHRLEPGEECPACDLTDPLTEGERELADRQERYAWFGEALRAAHAEGKVSSQAVRFFIVQQQPLLYDGNGEPALDRNGELIFDVGAKPIYFGRAQAYSYTADPATDPSARTVAGTMELSLEMLDRGDREMLLRFVCEDLNAEHARELAKARAQRQASGGVWDPASVADRETVVLHYCPVCSEVREGRAMEAHIREHHPAVAAEWRAPRPT